MIRYCDAYWNDVSSVLECVPNLKKISGRAVLITGATGMVCSSLVDLLLCYNRHTKASVHIILAGRSIERMCARFTGFQEGKDFTFLSYDALNQDGDILQSLDTDVDYIVHGAGNADPAMLTEKPVETMLTNMVGLNRLLKTACMYKSKRILYISSSEIYGNRPSHEREAPYREGEYGYVDILTLRAAYPSSKRAAETLCVSYGNEYGLDTVIVRPGHIYGPSITDTDSRASAQFTRSAAKGEDIVMKSPGTQLRSYCYTLDCASAILTVLLNGKKENAYNISNRDSVVTIHDMAEAFAKAGGVKVIFEEASLKEKTGYNLMTNSSLNAEKLENLGWKALFGLEEGAQKTLEFYSYV